jgi:hypothetical protein
VGASAQLSPRPLDAVAETLSSAYAVPVTYEDPILLWRGDMDGRESRGVMLLWAKDGLAALPSDVTPALTPKLDADALARVLDLYHQLNPDGPRFRLMQSKHGFHIVPDSVHDENGRRTGASSLLDAEISVPREARFPSGHMQALCDAVSAATGNKVDFFGPYFDNFYLPNGLIPPRELAAASPAEQARFRSTWGALQPAREALISVLEGSATTFSWSLRCSADVDPAKRPCTLTVFPIRITVTDADGVPRLHNLEFDRCGPNCPPLPPWPRPAPPDPASLPPRPTLPKTATPVGRPPEQQ